MATLHTNSAPESITRLLEIGLDPFLFSDSLLAILAQRLVRRLCTHCREAVVPELAELDDQRQADVAQADDGDDRRMVHGHGGHGRKKAAARLGARRGGESGRGGRWGPPAVAGIT